MLAFGGNLTGAGVLNYVVRNLDNVLIGWRWGAGPLGFYSKAYQLLLLPVRQFNSPVTTVAIPTLSHLQNDPDRYRGFYRRGISLIAIVGMPVVAFTFAAADDVVLVVLGPKWIEATRIFRALAPAAMVTAINVATTWAFISLGQTNRMLRWNIIEATVTTTAFIVGLQWGAIGVAAACSIALCLLWLPGVAYCFHGGPLRISDLTGMLWRPALAAIIAAAVVMTFDEWVSIQLRPLLSLAIGFIVFASTYTLIWLILPKGRKMVRETLQLTREMRSSQDQAKNRIPEDA